MKIFVVGGLRMFVIRNIKDTVLDIICFTAGLLLNLFVDT